MADSTPSLHHIVFCVHPENQDTAAAFWRDLGFKFDDLDLTQHGLRVLLDWDRGIEIISPTGAPIDAGQRAAAFLEQHGEGVYSTAVRVADVADSVAVASRHGASVDFHQKVDGAQLFLEEAQLSTLHGMPVTFLATNRPG